MQLSSEENVALVRVFLTGVVAGGDTDATSVFLAADIVDHTLAFEGGQDHEEVTALGWRVLAAADGDVELDEVVATTDRVAILGTVAGTHRESLMDLAPTGRPFEIPCAWFCRIGDGRIAEIRSLPGGLGLMRQIGAIPEGSPHRPETAPTDSHT